MARKLTGNLGVGVGELAADDDSIRLCLVELAAGLVPLAEEVVDESLGALIQGLEVCRELGIDVPAEIKNKSATNLEYSIGGEGKCITRDEDGAAEERRRSPRWHACCSPFA